MREDLEQQLEALLDKQAISELVHAYCNAADRHDFDKMRALYHDDAIDE
ncbi:MAG TPA: nuclear transport factor 2 family protein, partial [Solimonas sp.]